jgi:hypothetical protein
VQLIGSNSSGVIGPLQRQFNFSLTTDDVGAGFAFDMLFGNTTLPATVNSADFNGDGFVNGADFLIWQGGLGVGTRLAQGDANGNGVVDGADLEIWKSQFGVVAPSAAAFGAVPEPTSALLAVLAAIGIALRRRSNPSAA